MHLSSKLLTFLINFLLGIAWAAVLIGASLAFYLYRETGLLSLMVYVVLYAVPGVLGVVCLEYLMAGFRRSEEMRRQSRLLERIARELERRPER